METKLEPCPFCGHEVIEIIGTMELRFFKCLNRQTCGAVMSFDNDYYNHNPDSTRDIYNRRVK